MRLAILIILLSFLLLSCAGQDLPTSGTDALKAELPAVTKNSTKTPQPIPTEILPTATEMPTITSTPQPRIRPIPGVELFDFTASRPGWYTVDDNVMGGVSSSEVAIVEQDLAFSGTMSLDNNGGFSSVRSEWIPIDLSDYDGILLRVLGDGKTYRLRIRSAETGRDVSYNAVFETTPDKWEIFYLPFADMVPTYFGVEIDVGRLDTTSIGSFGFMLSDKQPGEFELLVDWIRVVSESDLEIVSMN